MTAVISNPITTTSLHDAEVELRERLKRSLQYPSGPHQRLAKIIDQLRERNWGAYLFGGFPRDLAIIGPSATPRDLDIVVEQASIDEVAAAFHANIRRRTRFGGLALTVLDWDIDIWPVRETWAFRTLWEQPGDVTMLPKTTFLNVEAVVVEVHNPSKKKRRIYEHGFFEGVRNRSLEVNLADNPYPALCVVRSLLLAAKIDFAIGPTLVEYIARHADALQEKELTDVQVKHYGRVKQEAKNLLSWIDAISKHHIDRPDKPYVFPELFGRQLDFFDQVSPELRRRY